MSIGEKVKYYRLNNKMTQQELSNKINVSRKTVSSWENNRSKPDIQTIIDLSSLFHVDVNELILDNNISDNYCELVKETNKNNRYRLLLIYVNLITLVLGYIHFLRIIEFNGIMIMVLIIIINLINFMLIRKVGGFNNFRYFFNLLFILCFNLSLGFLSIPANKNSDYLSGYAIGRSVFAIVISVMLLFEFKLLNKRRFFNNLK
ncbi:helix-turn-helix transcriptional regulator [Apilactobacillus kunkeei]|uniref:helix-turn-helix transcriptional regulator n=1 Tax=Apilactobacillus kunkeei TaxID=148814 RepID=UPI00200A0F0A|nr:helix-turn-helix transcriptional regulator [Apilactobacillus kunkeei]MCK8626658.1 helix-turn-helix domain-containing protein [Apilactobacillus kunkeei]